MAGMYLIMCHTHDHLLALPALSLLTRSGLQRLTGSLLLLGAANLQKQKHSLQQVAIFHIFQPQFRLTQWDSQGTGIIDYRGTANRTRIASNPTNRLDQRT